PRKCAQPPIAKGPGSAALANLESILFTSAKCPLQQEKSSERPRLHFRLARRTIAPNNPHMDQFTAHLDRGWDLAQRGDALGAEDSARRAMALEGDSPEPHNLMGYTRALRGDAEEALELYQQAIALDETFLEAILNAAEVCLHPLGD